MIDENYSSFTKTGPKKGNYKPDEPENHSKERKEGKGARARGKKTINSPVPKVSQRLFLRASLFS